MTDTWIALNQTRITLNRAMLSLQSSTAAEINGGGLNQLVKQTEQQLAQAERNFKTYYDLPATPGLEVALRDRLEAQYASYHDGLAGMLDRLKARDLEGMFRFNIEQTQNNMQAAYSEWPTKQTALAEQGVEQNQRAFTQMMWLLAAVALLVIGVVVACWFALRLVLIQPIAVEWQNEMSQLANGL